MRIFLVEDEPLIREGIKKYIQKGKAEWEIIGEAGDGELAYFKILKEKPDLVITDIKMPYMSGLELAKAVSDVLKDVKILILSGYGEFEYASEALRIGVVDYLLKPVFREDLYKAIDKVQSAIDEEQKQQQQYQQLNQVKEIHRYMECQQLFDKMVMGNFDMITLCEKAVELELDIVASCYNIVLIGEGPGKKLLTDEKIREVWEGYRNSEKGICFDRGSEGLAYLAKGMNAGQVTAHVKEFMEEIRAFFGENHYYVGTGEVAEGLRNLPECFYLASREFYHSYFQEDKQEAAEEDFSCRGNEMVKIAKTYIADHYKDEEISLNTVAAQVFLSPSHFSRIFSKEEGITFVEYLTKVRMEKAMEMLAATNMKIADISSEVGYKDAHYFTALFKRTVGSTPGDYRRRKRILKG